MPVAKTLLLAVAFSALVAPAAAGGFPDQASADSARRGAAYLASEQGTDGAVPARSKRPDEVAEAVMALVAGGGQSPAVNRALEYLGRTAQTFLQGPGGSGPRTGRVVSGLVAAGKNPRDFAGFDFVEHLESYYNPATASYGGADDRGTRPSLYADALAMLGVLASGGSLPELVVPRLELHQCESGGWSHQTPCNVADTDTTALVISVLAAATGTAGQEVRDARQWLLDTQRASGCWGYDPNANEGNANSCGLVLSAIVALGEDPGSAPWTHGAKDPTTALRAFQLESGGFKFRPTPSGREDISATKQAVPGLAGWSYPVRSPAEGNNPHGDNPADSGSSWSTTETTTTAGAADHGPGNAGSSDESATFDPPGGEHPGLTPSTRMRPTDTSTTTTTTIDSGDGSVRGKTVAAGTGAPGATARLEGGSRERRGRMGVVTQFAFGFLSSVTIVTAWWWRRRWKRTALGLIPFGSPRSKPGEP